MSSLKPVQHARKNVVALAETKSLFGKCGLCYCNDEYAFVDVFEQCETSYREEYAVVVR